METVKTAGNQPGVPGDIPVPELMGDGELLRYMAGQVEALLERCDGLEKRLDHADGIAHDVQQRVTHLTEMLEQYRPLLDRAQKIGSSPLMGWARPKGAT